MQMLSQHNDADKELMWTLSKLVEKYNQYLEKTQGEDQLNIHKELQNIIDMLEKFLPKAEE